VLSLSVASAVDTYASIAAAACEDKVGCAGYYRAITVSTSPPDSTFQPTDNVTGVSVGLIGISAAANATAGVLKLDAAGARFKTPADMTDGAGNRWLGFYFGYLGLGAAWDGSTGTAAVVGALAEVVAAIEFLVAYYDNDGTAGFQWNIGQTDPTKRWDIFNTQAGVTNKYDTVDPNGILYLNNLTWSPISHSSVSCQSVAALTGYAAGCEIHSLTTSGSMPGVTTSVITITVRIASQPVLINGVRHGPDLAKYDCTINFPWSSFSISNPATAKLAMVVYGAGKAGDFVGTATTNGDTDSLTFASADGKTSASYAYKNVATVAGVSANVYTSVYTGQQILNLQCVLGSPCLLTETQGFQLLLVATITTFQNLGWKPSLTIHAFGTAVEPATVEWDPQTGAGPSSSTSAPASNSACFAVPSFLFMLFLVLLQ